MKDEFVMVGDSISEGRELLGKGLGRIVEQQTVAQIKRAEQLQGEPAAWIYSRPEGQVEPVVLLKRASEGDRGSWDETPLYTHADPCEVERLREELDLIKISFDSNFDAAQEARTERDTLRAEVDQFKLANARLSKENVDRRNQLDEVHALLVKADYVIDHARTIDKQAFALGTQNVDPGLFRGLGNLLEQYDDALSASAEPSNDLCAEGAHEFVPFRSKCVKCGEPYSAEPSAREAQALKDESRLGIERLPAEHSTPDELEGVEDLARRIDARVKARAALERKP